MNETLITAWAQEYEKKGIPSSFRKDPTEVVVEFLSWAKEKGKNAGTAADIGCGLGRNSFYLAEQGFQVIAMDLLQENIDSVNTQAQLSNLPLRAHAQNVATPWPIASSTLDIAIDVFCYKHVVEKEGQKTYRKALWEALKPDGYFFISLASTEDGFYGPLLKTSPNPREKLIIDPHSNIPSFLYSLADLTLEFADFFKVVKAYEKSSVSPMYGKEYPRKVLNVIFQKILI